MITLQFNIRNPWSRRWQILRTWHGSTPLKNKGWELQTNKTSDILGFDLRLTTKQDHAGLFVCLSVLGYEAILNIYDYRHSVDAYQ